ncbi:MAG TPA: glycosyltransferase family 4 protein [Pyrinomonadaceae bacterium]|nr:glycosyltransferase family 4 protein [Pyrinomonadaceae bacterium]
MKILLIGSYPPPLGGVGVFIKRYKRKLEGEGHTVVVLDPIRLTKREFYTRLFGARFRSYDLVSLSFPSFHVMAVLLATGLAGKTEVWDHNWRVLEEWSPVRLGFYRHFLRRCRELILVAPHLKDYYREHGVELAPQTRVRHAFLPPPLEEEAEIVKTYAPETLAFVEAHRPVVVAGGFRINFHKGVDLYGLDMCVELIGELKKTHADAGLLFALGEFADADYRERIERRISELGVAGNVHFMTGQKEMWPLFRRADLMVRPTFTDGYAVSLAEALYMNCPAVASDAAERPAGTVIFANRDQNDFLRKCRDVLAARASIISSGKQ